MDPNAISVGDLSFSLDSVVVICTVVAFFVSMAFQNHNQTAQLKRVFESLDQYDARNKEFHEKLIKEISDFGKSNSEQHANIAIALAKMETEVKGHIQREDQK